MERRSDCNHCCSITHVGPRWRTATASICTSSRNQQCWRHPPTGTSTFDPRLLASRRELKEDLLPRYLIFECAMAARHHRPVGTGGSTQIWEPMVVTAIIIACTFVRIVSLVFIELWNVFIKNHLSSCSKYKWGRMYTLFFLNKKNLKILITC